MTEAQVKNLAKAVGRWLAFQVLCGRDVLLSESYLSQPLAEFLLHHHSGTLATERRHPGLQRGGRGRPRQVDFVLLSRDAEAAEAVIEAKWVTDRPYPKQAVVDDLLRLECFREGGRHVRRYFLVAGKKGHFRTGFERLQLNTCGGRKGFTRQFLSFKKAKPRRAVDVMNADGSVATFFVSFARAYKVELPRGFSTVLKTKCSNDGISVVLWQVESRRNRRTFQPRRAKKNEG